LQGTWYATMRRCGQININERDPIDMDVERTRSISHWFENAGVTLVPSTIAASSLDCNYAYEPAVTAHPEWFERDEDGALRPHGESTWLFKTCMFSPYFSEQMPAIYREINRRYPVDGFFTNGWPGTGALTVCFCDASRDVWLAMTNLE
jgi:hypothetical protein